MRCIKDKRLPERDRESGLRSRSLSATWMKGVASQEQPVSRLVRSKSALTRQTASERLVQGYPVLRASTSVEIELGSRVGRPSFRHARLSQSICILLRVFWMPVRAKCILEKAGNSERRVNLE